MEEGATVGLGLELIISSGVSSPSRVAWTPALAASPPTSDPWLRIAAAPAAVFSAFMYWSSWLSLKYETKLVLLPLPNTNPSVIEASLKTQGEFFFKNWKSVFSCKISNWPLLCGWWSWVHPLEWPDPFHNARCREPRLCVLIPALLDGVAKGGHSGVGAPGVFQNGAAFLVHHKVPHLLQRRVWDLSLEGQFVLQAESSQVWQITQIYSVGVPFSKKQIDSSAYEHLKGMTLSLQYSYTILRLSKDLS